MGKRLTVGIDVRDLKIAKTGARTYLEELVRQFKSREDEHYRFILLDTLIPVYTRKNKFLKAIEHFRFMLWKQAILPLKAWINGCDILFCTDFFVPYVHLGYKTVPVFHDAFFFEYPEHYNRAWLWLFRKIGIPSARRAAAIITPTHYTKQRIALLSGLNPSKILTVYEGPKTFPDALADSKIYQELQSARYILHIGTMEKRKNLVTLIKAFSMLLKSCKDPIKLVLGGQFSPKTDMDDRAAILSVIQEHQLEKDVLFPGYIPDSLLSTYYQHAEMYVFPSVNEGFGIPILEAFANNVPVLVANNTCLPEVGAEAVVQFDPFDTGDLCQKMLEVLENDDLKQQLRHKGRERLKSFSWSIAATQLLEIFKAIR